MKKTCIFTSVLLIVLMIFTGCSRSYSNYTGETIANDPVPSSSADGLFENNAKSDEASEATQQKLIKRYGINAESKNYDETVKIIDESVSKCGGYYEKRVEKTGRYGYGYGESRYLSAVIRIPENEADGFADGVRGAANVTSFSKSADNVTKAYVDTEARLQTLKTERESLLSMMSSLDKSSEFDFWYKLHERITDIEQQIAAYEAELRSYDSLISFSTVSVELYEVKEYTEEYSEESFGERISSAFSESWANFAEGCKSFAVFFVRAIPTLIMLGVISGGIFCAIYFPIKGAKKRRARKYGQSNNVK